MFMQYERYNSIELIIRLNVYVSVYFFHLSYDITYTIQILLKTALGTLNITKSIKKTRQHNFKVNAYTFMHHFRGIYKVIYVHRVAYLYITLVFPTPPSPYMMFIHKPADYKSHILLTYIYVHDNAQTFSITSRA
jgi:hypothetical protein